MPKDFHEHLAEKRGHHTPHKEWRDMGERLDDTEFLFMLRKTKDGVVESYASAGDTLEILGMLEIAKRQIIDTDIDFGD